MSHFSRPSDPRHWAIGTSTALFDPLTLEGLDACARAGVSHIELGIRSKWVESLEGHAELIQWAEAIKQAGLCLWSVHLPFGPRWDISSPDAPQRQSISQVFSTMLELVASLGAKQAVIHPSWEPVSDNHRLEALQRSKGVLHQLADVAARCGMSLAAECLPRTCLANCTDEMLELLAGSDTLRVCLDTSHLLKERAEDFIHQVGSRIATVHISDYDRVDDRHWLPGTGVNNWTAIISELARIGYNGPFLFELLQKTAGPLNAYDLVTCWSQLLNQYIVTSIA